MIESHGERISVSGNREPYWGIVRFLSWACCSNHKQWIVLSGRF